LGLKKEIVAHEKKREDGEKDDYDGENRRRSNYRGLAGGCVSEKGFGNGACIWGLTWRKYLAYGFWFLTL